MTVRLGIKLHSLPPSATSAPKFEVCIEWHDTQVVQGPRGLTCIWLRLPAVMLEMVQQASLRMDSLLLLSKCRRHGNAEQLRTTWRRWHSEKLQGNRLLSARFLLHSGVKDRSVNKYSKNYRLINFASPDFYSPCVMDHLRRKDNENCKVTDSVRFQNWLSMMDCL